MLFILIRTCPRDDYIGRLAYESLRKFYPTAIYVFLAEKGNYKYLVGNVVFRTPCDNFGGQAGANGLLEALRSVPISPAPSDVIFLIDSDIVMLRDIWNEVQDIDHGGACSTLRWGLHHVSGQFQILSGSFYSHLVSMTYSDFCQVVNEMLPKGIDIADDTVFSYISDKLGVRKKSILDGWVHYKLFEYNGNINFDDVIERVRRNPPKLV